MPAPLSRDALELLDLLAYVYLENNRPEKAVILLNALSALGQSDARSLALLALALLRSGKPGAALDALERVAMSGGVNAVFHLVRAQALFALERTEEAEAAMQAYVALRAAVTTTRADRASPTP